MEAERTWRGRGARLAEPGDEVVMSTLECLSWCALSAFAGHVFTVLYNGWREIEKNARETGRRVR